MLAHNPSELDEKSKFLGKLRDEKTALKWQLDQMSADIEHSTDLSNNAATQLVALHREYERAVEVVRTRKEAAETEAAIEAANYYESDTNESALAGGAVGAGVGVFLTVITGGAALPFIAGSALLGAGAGSSTYDDARDRRRQKLLDEKRQYIESTAGSERDQKQRAISKLQEDKAQFLAQLQTNEQQRLYHGVVKELLLNNGISVARLLEQFAQFNGTSVDTIVCIEDYELQRILERILTGYPKATDIDRLVAISDTMAGKPVVTPEMRTLKQFINQVLVPNRLYFDILASFADDVRDKDLSSFPPLEILGHKPISLSGRIDPSEAAKPDEGEEKMLAKAKAKVEIRERIAGGAVYEILKDDARPHMEKMKGLVDANEDEIATYAGIFSDIENAMILLTERQAELAEDSRNKVGQIASGIKDNAVLDGRIKEITARNDAKQEAAKSGSKWRAGLAVAGGFVMALVDGGATLAAVKAAGVKGALLKTAGHSLNSAVYGVGQSRATSVENAMLDDYMHSLALQKVDVAALQGELAILKTAIEKTKESKEYQKLLEDEARRTHVAETLLLRSLIRNGYNNSDDIHAIAKTTEIGSVDAFLAHYRGTRLGLALKKHCHGLADSNDISVILAESNCLRGRLSGADAALREYVEETMKPNIASYYSKASKMDVIAQNNLTGFGNELHFAAELQMETNRAVSLLTANEYGMSVVGRQYVRDMFDFWLHRHGDRHLYDDKIRDGEISDQEYPEKRVSVVPPERMTRFVDMAKRSVASSRASFPKVGDLFLRVCAHEYFLPQAIHVGGKDNIFTDYPESPSAYPMANAVVSEFIRKLSFADIDDYRGKIGDRLDNIIAQSFLDFFAKLGELHQEDSNLKDLRARLKDAANYDDYAPVFDRYARSITRDALTHFDLFLDIYKRDLEKHYETETEKGRAILDEQLARVKDLADGRLSPDIIKPGTYEARLRAHDENHTGENMLRRG